MTLLFAYFFRTAMRPNDGRAPALSLCGIGRCLVLMLLVVTITGSGRCWGQTAAAQGRASTSGASSSLTLVRIYIDGDGERADRGAAGPWSRADDATDGRRRHAAAIQRPKNSFEKTCLVLKQTIIIDHEPQAALGTICSGEDGRWTLVRP